MIFWVLLDVIYVGCTSASEELVKKARSLMLPDNFYLFLDKPPCPGCAGCEPESGDESGEGNTVLSTAKSPQSAISQATSQHETKKSETPPSTVGTSIFGGTPSLSTTGVSLNQPIFGSSSTTFSFGNAATFSFGQNLTTGAEKNQTSKPELGFGGLSSPQPFFSKESGFSSPDNPAISKSIFGNVSGGKSPAVQATSLFGNVNKETLPSSQQASQPGSIFGNLNKEASPSQPVSQPASLFSKDMPTFGSIAASSPSFGTAAAPPSFLNKEAPTFGSLTANPSAVPAFTTPKKENFSWEGTGSSLFSHLSSQPTAPASADQSKDEEDDPEKEAAVHFEPIVPLPDKIQLSTGEEDEEVLFDQRAKLFRYSTETKEWKERGIGNMKVLKHKTNNTYRLLMRREQVHKICCNLRITPDLVLKPMPNSEVSTTWAALNLAQEYTEPQLETLALKLKNKDILEIFKSVVNNAIAELSTSGSGS